MFIPRIMQNRRFSGILITKSILITNFYRQKGRSEGTEQCLRCYNRHMAKEQIHTCFDDALPGLAADIKNDPEPAAWIRRIGTPGDYTGWGRVLRLPYQAFLILVGYVVLQATLEKGYAYHNNLIALKRLEWACPYRGAIVLTDVPLEGGGTGTYTLS